MSSSVLIRLAQLFVLSLFSPLGHISELKAVEFEGRYRLTVGDENHPIQSGKVWIYGAGWGWINRVQVAEIHDGMARMQFDVSDFPFIKYDGRPTAEKFIAAIELDDGSWYRGPDYPSAGERKKTHVPVRELIENFGPYFHQLGRLDSLEDGVMTLVLPPLVERRLTFLHEDGAPAAGMKVPIDLYVAKGNHCGVHQGLRVPLYDGKRHLAVEVTDNLGQVVFRSQPGAVLYVDLSWWPRTSPPESPWGWREHRIGVRTDTSDNVVIRSRWEPIKFSTVELEIRDRLGRPVSGHQVVWHHATKECGSLYWNKFGPSDPDGRVTMRILGEATREIDVLKKDPEKYSGRRRVLKALSEDERGRLVRDGELTLTLDTSE